MIHDMCDNSKPSGGQTREFLPVSPTLSEVFVKTIFVCLLGFFVRIIGLCNLLIGTMGFLFVVVGHVGTRVCSLRQSWQRQVAALGRSSKVFRSLEQVPTPVKLSTFRDGLADKRLSFGGRLKTATWMSSRFDPQYVSRSTWCTGTSSSNNMASGVDTCTLTDTTWLGRRRASAEARAAQAPCKPRSARWNGRCCSWRSYARKPSSTTSRISAVATWTRAYRWCRQTRSA